MRKQNNIITSEVLILAMWFIEKKYSFSMKNRYPWWTGLAMTLFTAYSSNNLKYTSLKRSHNKVNGLKIVASNFHKDFFRHYRSYSSFCKDRFLPFLHTIMCITQEPLKILKSNYLTWKNVRRSIRITISCILTISFIICKIDLLGQIYLFSP